MNKTITLLKNVILDKNCKRMNLSVIKGYLGELLSYKLLTESFPNKNIIHKGNQSSYDFEFENIKIDVKTSTIKDDMQLGFDYWGWALVSGNKKREINFTHLLCIALDTKLNIKKMFVINSSDLNNFEKGLGQFKNVKKAFVFTESENIKYKKDEHRDLFESNIKLLKKKIIKEIKDTNDLKRALNCI